MTAPWPYTFPSHAAEPLLGVPREFRIPRNGDRDLWFKGWSLGHAEGRKNAAVSASGVDVDIYLPVGKRLVAHVCQWSLREGAGLAEDHRVAALESPAQAISWLKQDNAGRLGYLAKRAWVQACASWPGLESEAVERVE
jgi:hypothetical protein